MTWFYFAYNFHLILADTVMTWSGLADNFHLILADSVMTWCASVLLTIDT